MHLTVLHVAYPLAPVSPDAVGGAEQIVSLLDAGLVRRGHRSIVIGCAGSRCLGQLVETPQRAAEVDVLARQRAIDAHREAIARSLREFPIDVVHLHGIDFLAYLPRCAPPKLATLHLPPQWYPPEIFEHAPDGLYLNCVSDSQHARCPAGDTLLPPVANGIDVAAFSPIRHKRDFALMLGRICPEKGFDRALDAAHRAGASLLIAGQVFDYPDHQRYFRECVLPRLDARRRFIGALSLARKRRLLAAARCVLIPSLAPETSSLVAMEALASGTPVIAFRSGALPEIVEDGRTGFIVDDTEQMVERLRSIETLCPRACRHDAERRFDAAWMVERYLARYAQLRRAATARHAADRPATAPSWTERELSTREELAALRPAWSDLHTRCHGTPFQTPEWLLSWCDHYDITHVRCLAIYRGPRLVGLAPMLNYQQGTTRILTLLGSAVSDYQDVLFDPEHAESCRIRLQAWLSCTRRTWDHCDFEQLRDDSRLLPLALGPIAAADMRRQACCPVLPLCAEPRANVPERLHKNLDYAERRLARDGTWQMSSAHDTAAVTAAMESLVRLHHARWSERGQRDAFADPRFAAFLGEVARAFSARGILRLYALHAERRAIAVLCGFRDATRFYYYLGGFDPAWSKYSPGALLVRHAIQNATAEGIVQFDFLRGAEPYKYTWGARDTWNHRLTFVQHSRPVQTWRSADYDD